MKIYGKCMSTETDDDLGGAQKLEDFTVHMISFTPVNLQLHIILLLLTNTLLLMIMMILVVPRRQKLEDFAVHMISFAPVYLQLHLKKKYFAVNDDLGCAQMAEA